jgi:DHA2 family multidrug resistance protein-like MFS transporter
MGLLFFFSQYLQLVRGLSPLAAGLVEMPTMVAAILAITVVGVLVARLGIGRAVAVGLVAAAIGLVLVAVAEDADHLLWLAAALLPLGLGIGIAMTLTTDAVVSAVPPQRAGAASAIAETAFELGGALGIAVLGSAVTLVYQASLDLPADVSGPTRAAVEDSLASAINTAGHSSGVVEAARAAFTTAMQVNALAAATITVIAALIAWRTIPSGRKSGTTTTTEE